MEPKKKNTKKSLRPRVLLVTRCIVLNKQGKFLLIKRPDTTFYAPGLWEFPGGKLDEGQDLSNALEREVLEETGLLVMPVARIAYTESWIIPEGKHKGLPYVILIGIGRLIGGKLKLTEDHTEYKWVSETQAYEMELNDEIRKALIVLSKNIKQIAKEKNR